MAVKPIKRVRCELQAKVNGALSADSDPRFIDRVCFQNPFAPFHLNVRFVSQKQKNAVEEA